MKYLSSINRTDNCWNRFGNTQFEMYLCFLFSVTPSHVVRKWKSLNYELSQHKENWTHETLTRKIFGNTKHSREKNLDPRNTHEKKFQINKIPTRKNIEPTKQPQRHNCSRLTRLGMARDQRNLAHSSLSNVSFLQAMNLFV